MIPSGDEVVIPAQTGGYITQALGGSYTVFIDGNLFRIGGQDADAIGMATLDPPKLRDGASDTDVESLIWSQMKTCFDPEIPVDVVELGLIYDCQVRKDLHGKRSVHVKMTLTAPGCGMGDILVDDVRSKVGLVPTVNSVQVDLVFDPPWHQNMMSDVAKLETGML